MRRLRGTTVAGIRQKGMQYLEFGSDAFASKFLQIFFHLIQNEILLEFFVFLLKKFIFETFFCFKIDLCFSYNIKVLKKSWFFASFFLIFPEAKKFHFKFWKLKKNSEFSHFQICGLAFEVIWQVGMDHLNKALQCTESNQK